jgi:hypothetical protein
MSEVTALRRLARKLPRWIVQPNSLTEARATALQAADRIEALEAAAKDALAHLVAATSLLDRGGKKAAASDKIFDQMLIDYNNSINRVRGILTHGEIK